MKILMCIGLVITAFLYLWQMNLPIVHFSTETKQPINCFVKGEEVSCSEINLDGLYEKVWVR